MLIMSAAVRTVMAVVDCSGVRKCVCEGTDSSDLESLHYSLLSRYLLLFSCIFRGYSFIFRGYSQKAC
jgi:hypothetical protein